MRLVLIPFLGFRVTISHSSTLASAQISISAYQVKNANQLDKNVEAEILKNQPIIFK
jgi:hypothetical protein